MKRTVTGEPRSPTRVVSTDARAGSRPGAAASAADVMTAGSSWTAAARAAARAAASTRRRSRTNKPTWTRASTTTSTSGRTNANSTVADPADPRSLRGIGVPDDRVDDVIEERWELARRARPRDQDHGDRGGGEDHERVLRGGLPLLPTEERGRPDPQCDPEGSYVGHGFTSSQRMDRTVVSKTGTTVRRRNAGKIRKTSGNSILLGAVRARSNVAARRAWRTVAASSRVASASEAPRLSVRCRTAMVRMRSTEPVATA